MDALIEVRQRVERVEQAQTQFETRVQQALQALQERCDKIESDFKNAIYVPLRYIEEDAKTGKKRAWRPVPRSEEAKKRMKPRVEDPCGLISAPALEALNAFRLQCLEKTPQARQRAILMLQSSNKGPSDALWDYFISQSSLSVMSEVIPKAEEHAQLFRRRIVRRLERLKTEVAKVVVVENVNRKYNPRSQGIFIKLLLEILDQTTVEATVTANSVEEDNAPHKSNPLSIPYPSMEESEANKGTVSNVHERAPESQYPSMEWPNGTELHS